MGVCLAETGEDRERRVLDLYRMYKSRRFCSSTPTLFNAGTPHSQLSSCYLYNIDDTLSSIVGRGIAENAMCSKWAGGLGGSWTAVRGTGSHIESTNGESQGVVPVPEDAQRPAGRRQPGRQARGLGLRLPGGVAQRHPRVPRAAPQHRRRATPHPRHEHRLLDPGPVHEARRGARHWTLFRSTTCPTCTRLYGGAFDDRYEAYERRAAAGEIFGETIPAIELWKPMLRMLFETGHPWITFKDPCNVRSPQDHAGVIHSSNLCTEITLNTSDEETAVCNLGSVVLDQHLTADG